MKKLEELTRYKLTGNIYYYEILPSNQERVIELLNQSKNDVGVSINFNLEEFKSIDFINKINRLVGIRIIGEHLDLEPLKTKSGIQSLILDGYKKLSIDFSKMVDLIEVRADWSPSIKNLFEATKLRHLALWGFKPKTKDCSDIHSLKKLESLMLTKGNIESLNGISELEKLKSLELNFLRSLTDISGLQDFDIIEIESCPKIQSLDSIFSQRYLKSLVLINCGEVSSLSKIKNCKKLEYFNFRKTLVGDGCLNMLTELKSLEDVKFDNKKHYSHTLKEVLVTIESR